MSNENEENTTELNSTQEVEFFIKKTYNFIGLEDEETDPIIYNPQLDNSKHKN